MKNSRFQIFNIADIMSLVEHYDGVATVFDTQSMQADFPTAEKRHNAMELMQLMSAETMTLNFIKRPKTDGKWRLSIDL